MTPDGGPSWPVIETVRRRLVVELDVEVTVSINGAPMDLGDAAEFGRGLVETAAGMDPWWERVAVVSGRWSDG